MVRAYARGAVAVDGQPHVATWDVYGSCHTPVTRVFSARGEGEGYWRYNPGHATLIARVPCRQCEGCLRFKAIHWRARARQECAWAPRTWFGTLTMRPHEHFEALCRISVSQRSKGVPLDLLNDAELFKLRAADMGKHATRYFKRLRKAGAAVRYLLVTEAHKSGLPHLHLLVHDVRGAAPTPKRLLQGEWYHGFSSFRLVEDQSTGVGYVTKYIAKSMMARVRASLSYGSQFTPQGIVSAASVINSHLLDQNAQTLAEASVFDQIASVVASGEVEQEDPPNETLKFV